MTHTTKHTPGPWKVEPGINHIKVWGERPKTGPSLIAEVRNEGTAHSTSGAREQANAVLIAAAPAMYEALQWARQYLRMPNFHPDNSYNSEQWARDYNKLTDALAQAEGRDK